MGSITNTDTYTKLQYDKTESQPSAERDNVLGMSKVTYVCGMLLHLQCALSRLILQHILVVCRIHLLQEDESQHSVGSQTGVVRGKSLPQAEEAFLANHLYQHILSTNHTRTPVK